VSEDSDDPDGIFACSADHSAVFRRNKEICGRWKPLRGECTVSYGIGICKSDDRSPSVHMAMEVSTHYIYGWRLLEKIQKMHFPVKWLNRKLMVPSEISVPQELSNEWSCQYVSIILNFFGNFSVQPLVTEVTISP
jgi:hypothetical protein